MIKALYLAPRLRCTGVDREINRRIGVVVKLLRYGFIEKKGIGIEYGVPIPDQLHDPVPIRVQRDLAA